MGLELCLPRVAIDACPREQSQAADPTGQERPRKAPTYVCGSRLSSMGMERMGKQGSITREYLKMALSGCSDPIF